MDPFYALSHQHQIHYDAYLRGTQQQQQQQHQPHSSPSSYTPYTTNNALNEALAVTADGVAPGHENVEVADPWNELASWYWDLWNDHDTLFAPKANDAFEREPSYDSNESVVNDSLIPEDRALNIPEKAFRDQLVLLYFNHVHPLCPIFDEHEFYTAYCNSEDGLSSLQCITLLEFQAMLFAGSLHLNSTQLAYTGYTSTHECHKALFKVAKNTYHACQHESRIASTRVALLLSLWAPYNTDHSNSYWVDQACANAQAANLYYLNHTPTIIPLGRRKLIWMSCLRRDRFLAVASRRSQRVNDQVGVNLTATREDWGIEAVEPRFMTLLAKWQAIENFNQQCDLSYMMLRLLKFQRTRGSEKNRDWAAGVDMTQLLEATSIHAQLKAWRRGAEFPFQEGHAPGIGNCDAPSRLTSIFYESAIAFLYLPYIFVRERTKTVVTKEFSEVALQEVTTACSNIAQTIEVFVDAANSNDIPLSLGAWILLPIAVKLVFLCNDARGPTTPNQDLQEMRNLMTMLYIIKNRYSGGEFVSTVLDTVISHLQNNKAKRGPEALSLLQDAAEIIDKGLAHRIVMDIPKM